MPNWKKIIVSGSDASLNSLKVTLNVTASSFTGSFTGSLLGTSSYASTALTASNALTASFVNPLRQIVQITGSLITTGSNTLIGNTSLTGSFNISGSEEITGYVKFMPVSTNIDNSVSASYIYVSGSTNDLYFSQNGKGFSNTTRLRWLEGNLYTGLLNGGLITATTGSTVFNIASGSGIVVTLNASLNDNPYPTIKYVSWPAFTSQSLTYRTTDIQTFVGIDSNGAIIQQNSPWNDGQYNTSISLGTVLHQNKSTINASITYPNVAYGYKQRTYDFIKAFGPLKLSGLNIITSGSLGLNVGSGTAWADGRNYQNDPSNPSYITDTGTSVSKIFRYYQSGSSFVQDTNGGLGYTSIDPANYNNNGTLTAVPGNGSNRQYSVQRVFWYPNSATKGIVVYYGNATYPTLTDAVANIPYETFFEVENTKQNAVYLGAIAIRNDGVFTDSTSYTISAGGIFRQVGGSGGGGAAPAARLVDLVDVSITGSTDGQALVYDTTSLKWKNSSYISASISGNALTATSASNAATASSADNFTVRGTLTAQTIVVQTITSSTDFVTGSSRFGSTTANTHQFTGSVGITGSLFVQGNTGFNTTSSTDTLTINVPTSTTRGITFKEADSNVYGARISYNESTDRLLINTINLSSEVSGISLSRTSANVGLNSTLDTGYKLYINGSGSASGSLLVSGSSVFSGSVTTTTGFTGSLFGTASYATQALTASNANTASYVLNAVSASYIATASYALNANSASNALTASFVNPLRQNIQLTGSLFVSSSTVAASLIGSGSAVFSVDGTSGRLFSIDDSLSGSLFSVNTAAGLPVIEAFSDNTVRVGQFGQKALYVSQSKVGIGTELPTATLQISGSTGVLFEIDSNTAQNILYVTSSGRVGIGLNTPVSGTLHVSGNVFATSFTGSLLGTASYASQSLSASFASTASYVLNAVSASFASTASSADNFTVRGTLTAQTIVVQTITSSTDFVTGSSRFGSTTANTHQFTGSVTVSGSLAVNGSNVILSNQTSSMSVATASYVLNAVTASYVLNAVSASYATSALTASYALTAPYSGLQGTVPTWNQNTTGTAATASYVLNAVTASYVATSSYALNADLLDGLHASVFATTSSNQFNGSQVITGSLMVGTVFPSALANENTLTVGLPPAGGTGEGGQILLQASGGIYTSASMIDNWQNQTRLLRGTNAGSDAVVASFNMGSKQVQFPAYNSSTAFSGTAVANVSVDSNGNLITTAIGSSLTGGSGSYIARWSSATTLTTGSIYDTGTNVSIGNISPSYKLDVSGDIRATGAVYANANGTMYFRGGDDAELWDINTVNTIGVYGQQNQTVGSIKLGSSGGTISGYSSSIGIGTVTPNNTLQVVGGVTATSFTGSLLGTASYASQALTSSFATLAQTANTASYVLNAVSSSYAATASFANNFTVAGTLTAQTIVAQTVSSSIVYSSGSNRFGNDLTNTQVFTGSVGMTGSLTVNNSVLTITGSLPTPLIIGRTGGPNSNIQYTAAGYSMFAGNRGTGFGIGNAQDLSVVSQLTVFGATGNVVIQNGGSPTDTGFRLDVSGSTRLNGAVTVVSASIQSQITSSLASGTQTISTNATASYTAAFYNYTLASGSNTRAGQFIATWNGGSIQYMDNSTVDIGNTSTVALTASLSGANVLLTSTLPSSGWTIKTLVNLI